MMEQKGLTRRDLEPAVGSRARVSEILNRRRPLTLPMVRALSALLNIPIDVLAQPYETRSVA
jgi:HTH-type transcriptional regulator/antitoxin HigA